MPQKITELQEQLETIIKGKKEITDKILMAVLAKGHVLLEDVPGVGKTTTALALSRLMGMDFNRIQFTPDVVPSDVTGFTMYDKQSGQFLYRPGAVMCNLLLADEINRTSSKTQSALLEVMEEGRVTVDGVCSYCNRKSGGIIWHTASSRISAGPFYDQCEYGLSGSSESGRTLKRPAESQSTGKCQNRSYKGRGSYLAAEGPGSLRGRCCVGLYSKACRGDQGA